MSSVKKVEGDAVCNIRKGKKRIGFEMQIELALTGVIADGEGTQVMKETSGSIELPYVCEDVDDRKFEAKVSGFSDPRIDNAAKTVFRPAVLAKIHQWIQELEDK